jgi:serine/threonine protein kinase
MIIHTGGSFIGEGSYGCVFKPLIKCQNLNFKELKEIKKEKGQVIGKILETKNLMVIEYNSMMKIRQLDPKYNFTVKMFNTCFVLKKDLLKGDIHKYCKYSQNKKMQNIYYQIIYKYGGEDLTNFNVNEIKFGDFFISCKNILKGLITLEKNDIIHLDIAPRNLLYDKSTKKMKLIDFGLAKNTVELLFEDDCLFDFKTDYYPPEFKLYQGFKNFGTQFSEEIYLITLIKNYNLDIFEDILNIDIIQESKEIYKIYYNILKKEGMNGVSEFFSTTFNKIDIYSFGYVLLKLIKEYNISNKINDINFKIIKLISKMVNFNPLKRIDSNTAYNEYKKLILLI